MERLISFFGLILLLLFLVGVSTNRKNINWRTVFSGVGLQIFLGLIILKSSLGQEFFEGARALFTGILNYTSEGSSFIFGPLTDTKKFGFIFFVMVLPTIIFTSSLMSVLYHLGVMQFVIRIVAKVMVVVMGTSGAESLSAAANIFAGQTEAPLVVKPFISKMTRSELLALMTGGMATVAGGVLAAYVGFGIDAAHLLAASVMSAPAALVCAKILLPETEESLTKGVVKADIEERTENLVDAAAQGASDGLQLALNVGAMLLAFIALIAMVNGVIGWFGGLIDHPELSLELITGYVLAPVAFMLGVPWADCQVVGSLLGKKLILNEFVAYLDLTKQMAEMSPRAVAISTYALCGFANFSSIAIQVGGIGVLAPERRKDLASLGMKSLIAGTVACLMTACIAGMFL
ncbi:NupC/NupG family nucleoside CNT transporter [Bacteriovorax sp. Seq25_V]|uniref:NupC/NupG family nucleoside CNT transporter n=1 Tax=Bacteriovorax sp. Seq25_V TaxID=1201288 RepID=UPI000389EE5A|nr:NupC/NupG family nucleoside CNT transporter [Bacteriovorax sp. Seq25_V]EQC45605.1 nucleoside transporter, NupC family [Bacteriovorax sp. Seq25_V]